MKNSDDYQMGSKPGWTDHGIEEPKVYSMSNYGDGPFIPPGYSPMGKCSKCGGIVVVPSVWMGVVPPPRRCLSCGAKARAGTKKWHDDLPTIDME